MCRKTHWLQVCFILLQSYKFFPNIKNYSALQLPMDLEMIQEYTYIYILGRLRCLRFKNLLRRPTMVEVL